MSPKPTRGPKPTDQEVRVLAARLRAAREKKHLSYQQLADAVGASQQTLRRFEEGSGLFAALVVARIARAVNLPLGELFSHVRSDREATDLLWEKHRLSDKLAGSRNADFMARRAILKAMGFWER